MISKETLDKDTLKYLESLLKKSQKDLSVDEINFLWARKEYLTEAEIKNIPSVQEAEVIEEVKPIKWQPKKK